MLERRNDINMKTKLISILFAASASLAACGVDSEGDSTGGVDLGGAGGEGGEGGDEEPIRGFAVVGSDYTSTNVSLLSVTGEVESASFISSASREPGLSAALSGDASLSGTTLSGDELVVIDRSLAVLTWVNLRTAEVRAQLSVATGFGSNPQDYVPYTDTKAFVTRYEPNLADGEEPFDGGDDVLIVDPSAPEIVGRIDLTPALDGEPDGFHPRAGRAFLAGGKLRVLALGFNTDFTDSLAPRLITIDPDTHAIEDVLVFEGMTSCGSAALSPDGEEIAIGCSGAYGQDPALGFPDSGVLVVAVDDAPQEIARWTSDALEIDQVGSLAWLDGDHLAVLTSGRLSADFTETEANDAARTLNVRDGSVSAPWLETMPFNLADVTCSLKESICLVADGETDGGVVQKLSVGASGDVTVIGSVKPAPEIGLPPRSFGTY